MKSTSIRLFVSVGAFATIVAACGSQEGGSGAGTGGAVGTGGTTSSTGTGGSTPTSGTGGATSTGGAPSTGTGGVISTGGALGTGGQSATGGRGTGGTGTGGSGTSTGGVGGRGTGGSGIAGNSGSGGSGTGGQGSPDGGPPPGGDRWGGLHNPPVKSAGCGKPAGITTGIKTITSGGTSRDYAIDVPANYDDNKPSIVVFGYHYSGGSASVIKGSGYYHLQPLATADNISTIFIAPNHSAGQADHAVFLEILAYVEANLCVDTSRVFSMGYSLGAMMSYSLSTNHQDKLRAVATIEAANFNVWLPNPKIKEPIAYMGITGMADTLCMWDGGTGKGAKYIALEKAADNGCTVPAGNNIPTWTSGNHITYEFQGCRPDYPLVVPTFGGPHGGAEVAKDPGSSSSWVPPAIWEFFKRF